MGNRVQVFKKSGEFVNQVLIRPETRSLGTAWDVALSRDPNQQWLVMSDGSNHVVWLIDRKTLKIADHFGTGGRNAGQFGWVHNLDIDSKGKYLHRRSRDREARAEIQPGRRLVQIERQSLRDAEAQRRQPRNHEITRAFRKCPDSSCFRGYALSVKSISC